MIRTTTESGARFAAMGRAAGAAAAFAIIAVLMVVPSYVDGITVFWLSGMLISMLFAASYHLLLGTTGLLSFGHAAHFGIGAYVAGVAYREEFGFLSMIALCLLVSLVAALLLGFMTLRSTGVQFAILTLAFSMVAHQTTFIFRGFTGGDDGISALSPPPLELFGMDVNLMVPGEFFRLLTVVVVVCLAVLFLIDKSSLGHTLRAIRDDSIRSQYLGFRPMRYRMTAFALSGTFAGVAGALFVTLNGIVTPNTLYWTTSSLPLIMVLIGGMRSFWGAVIGAVVYEGLMYLTADVVRGVNIYLGLLVLVVVLFMPKGVIGIGETLRRLATRLHRAPGRSPVGGPSAAIGSAPLPAELQEEGATSVH